MRYLLAIILPPVAVLLCGKPLQFFLSILLTLCFWIPGVIHAILVVNSHLADQRTTRLEKAIRESTVQTAVTDPKENRKIGYGTVIAAVFLVVLLISIFQNNISTRSTGSSSPAAPAPNQNNTRFTGSPNTNAFAQDTSYSEAQICRATVAVIMGRDPFIMKTDRVVEGVFHLSYVRPDDGARWAFKCKIEGQRILWGNIDGRWRDHPDDEVFTYAVSGGQLHIKELFGDGSVKEEFFSQEVLGE